MSSHMDTIAHDTHEALTFLEKLHGFVRICAPSTVLETSDERLAQLQEHKILVELTAPEAVLLWLMLTSLVNKLGAPVKAQQNAPAFSNLLLSWASTDIRALRHLVEKATAAVNTTDQLFERTGCPCITCVSAEQR